VHDMRNAHSGDLGLTAWLPPFLLGFLAASFQVFVLREFAAEFYGSELVFGLFLGAWLFWGGFGSLVRPPTGRPAGTARLAGLYALAIALFFAGLVALRFSHRIMGVLPAELTGLAPALAAALILGLLLSFPLGHGFVLNAALRGGDVAAVYLLESAGAAAAGLFVHFGLIPRLSNWQGAAVIGALGAVAVFLAMRPGRWRPVLAGVVALAAALAGLDGPAQKAAWSPLHLVASRDTLYGKLQVIRTQEQLTFFDNGWSVFSQPDQGAAEEAVHFALLQRRGPRRALLIGGGASGGAAEALKHPGVQVDCVELDPAVVRLVREQLTGPARAALVNPRVRVITSDGRAFVTRTVDHYDAILLNLPEPATAQVNRYYTREFFLQVKRRLNPGGVFGFVLPAAENYISDALSEFLSSIAATLRGVFPEVRAVPGANCVFLASDGPLTIDAGRLAAEVGRLGLDVRYVAPAMLRARLDPDRVARLAGKLKDPRARINRDLVPVSYYFHSVLWAGQFRGFEAALLRTAASVPSFWLLDAPLAVFAIYLLALLLGRKRSPARFLVPVAVMGVTSIAVELAVVVAFQANFGVVYGKIPLLIGLFMAGLALGALAARARKRPAGIDLAAIQGGFVLLLAMTSLSLSGVGGEPVPFALIFGFGALGGALFVSASRRLLPEAPHPGLAYGVDQLASFAGVVLASGLIIPLFGIPALLLRLTVLNALCFFFLLAPSRS
jgi:spermidine synthase